MRLECAQSFDIFSLVALKNLTFNHKGEDILFHTIPEKRMFAPIIGFGKPEVPSSGCSMKLRKYHGFELGLFT